MEPASPSTNFEILAVFTALFFYLFILKSKPKSIFPTRAYVVVGKMDFHFVFKINSWKNKAVLLTQRTDSIFRICFAFSQWPHLHKAFLLRVPYLFSETVWNILTSLVLLDSPMPHDLLHGLHSVQGPSLQFTFRSENEMKSLGTIEHEKVCALNK